MKTPIALHNLWYQRIKTLVSIGGVAFALLLVFMQLGFMGAVSYTATNLIEKLDFDVLIRPRDYLHLYEASTFERRWLEVAQSTEGVASAEPFWIMIQNWRKLPTKDQLELLAAIDSEGKSEVELGNARREVFDEQFLPIAIMAYEPNSRVFDLAQVQEATELLHDSNVLLLDDATQKDYGPWNGQTFSEDEDIPRSRDVNQPQRIPEVGGVEYEIGGLFQLGTGLAANAAAIMGDRAFARISPWDTRQSVSLGLVRLDESLREDPVEVAKVVDQLRLRVGTDAQEVERLRAEGFGAEVRRFLGSLTGVQTTGEVEVMTKAQAGQREQYRWLWETPIGLIFQMGVLLSLVVGAVIVYMVLSTDVSNRLPEYATLLAMGYSRKYLAAIVMTQAMVLCAFGFLAAWLAAEALYRVTTYFSGIPLIMNPVVIVLVGVLGVVMCNISGMLAMRKLWKAEPASLF